MKICQNAKNKSENNRKFCDACEAELSVSPNEPVTSYMSFSGSEITELQMSDTAVSLEIDTGHDFTDGIAKVSKKNTERALAENEEALKIFETAPNSGGYEIKKLINKSEVKVNVPSSVTVIGDEAFAGSDIIEVELPDGLIKIGSRAFANCKDLREITFNGELWQLADDAFEGCDSLHESSKPKANYIKHNTSAEILTDALKKNEEEKKAIHDVEAEVKDFVKQAESSLKEYGQGSAQSEAEINVKEIKKQAELILKHAQQQEQKATQALNEANAKATQIVEKAQKDADNIKAKHKGMHDEYNAFITKANNDAKNILKQQEQKAMQALNEANAKATQIVEKAQKDADNIKAKHKGMHDEYNAFITKAKNNAQKILQEAQIELFSKAKTAAANGDPEAQLALANMYYNGNGIGKDRSEAFTWFMKAAKQGKCAAMEMVGDCYKSGIGVMKSDTKAFEWYKRAADKGSKKAMEAVGDCYYNGEGTAKNFDQAIKYYELAQ